VPQTVQSAAEFGIGPLEFKKLENVEPETGQSAAQSMILRLILVLSALCLLLLPLPPLPLEALRAAAPGGAVVQGRIELLNPKLKLRNGKGDASGVVVWLEGSGNGHSKAPHPRRTLVQRDKRFSPHVLAIPAGSEVDFPNEDPFFHNVFSLYNGRRFDLGLYASGETRPVVFSRPGISFIFCNIHPQMSAVVVALETSLFGVSEVDGSFTINDVPEGKYRLQIWHERSDPEQLAAQSRPLQVTGPRFDLGVIRLDEQGYISRPHRNKFGEDYRHETDSRPYKKTG
jgi:plastocyanin